MRNLYFAAILIASFTLSCTNDSPSGYFENSGEIISFDIVDSDMNSYTRASATTSLDQIEDIGIFAFNTLDQSWETASESALPNLFNNISLVRDGDSWSYGDTQYWPDLGSSNVSFFAYSPYHTSTTCITAPSADYDKGVPSIDFSVERLSAAHIDLMVTTAQTNMSGGAVNLHLNHALTKIGFKAQLEAEAAGQTSYISSIEVEFRPSAGTVYGTGTLDLETMEWGYLRNPLTTPITDIAMPTEPVILSTVSQMVVDDSGYLLMPPQDIAQGALVVNMTMVTVFDNGSSSEDVFSEIEIPAHSWVMGGGHNYLFTINASDKVVESKCSVTSWDQVSLPDLEFSDQYYLWVESGSVSLSGRNQRYYLYYATDHPGGISIELDDPNSIIRHCYIDDDYIYIRARNNDTDEQIEATLTVTAGAIVREISIIQEPN